MMNPMSAEIPVQDSVHPAQAEVHPRALVRIAVALAGGDAHHLRIIGYEYVGDPV